MLDSETEEKKVIRDMNNQVKISVIIATFNYGHFIQDAIDSVLNQTITRSSYEIIVVDDGSTDDTQQRVGLYDDVTYIYKANGGQASAFNTGIAVARGEYAAFLDADDYWSPNKLAAVLQVFENNEEIDLIYHALAVVDNQHRQLGTVPSWSGSFNVQKPIENRSTVLSQFTCATSGMVWRMNTLWRLLPIPTPYKVCADAYLMTCAALVVRKFFLISSELGFYRIHGGNGYSEIRHGLVGAKLLQTANYYRKLCCHNYEKLALSMKSTNIETLRYLTAICFTDDLLQIKRQFGARRALLVLWQGRHHLKGFSGTYKIYRVLVVLMQLLLTPPLFCWLQQLSCIGLLRVLLLHSLKNAKSTPAFPAIEYAGGSR